MYDVILNCGTLNLRDSRERLCSSEAGQQPQKHMDSEHLDQPALAGGVRVNLRSKQQLRPLMGGHTGEQHGELSGEAHGQTAAGLSQIC
jgi:hypothetical protein